jgi:hypothetical protein
MLGRAGTRTTSAHAKGRLEDERAERKRLKVAELA